MVGQVVRVPPSARAAALDLLADHPTGPGAPRLGAGAGSRRPGPPPAVRSLSGDARDRSRWARGAYAQGRSGADEPAGTIPGIRAAERDARPYTRPPPPTTATCPMSPPGDRPGQAAPASAPSPRRGARRPSVPAAPGSWRRRSGGGRWMRRVEHRRAGVAHRHRAAVGPPSRPPRRAGSQRPGPAGRRPLPRSVGLGGHGRHLPLRPAAGRAARPPRPVGGTSHRGARRLRQADHLLRAGREPYPHHARRDPGQRPPVRGGGRGRPLLRAHRRRPGRHRPGRVDEPGGGQDGPGRLHHHPAGHQERDRRRREGLRPEVPRGHRRRPPRAVGAQGRDPRRLPQPHLLRRRCVRDRGRGPHLLRRLGGRALACPRRRCWPGSSPPRAGTTPAPTRSWPRIAASWSSTGWRTPGGPPRPRSPRREPRSRCSSPATAPGAPTPTSPTGSSGGSPTSWG